MRISDWSSDVCSSDLRAERLPRAAVDPALPIAAHADDIVALVRDNPVVVIAGETGSGKATRLPKLCLAAGLGAAGMSACTQPRRIAARAGAGRVAGEVPAGSDGRSVGRGGERTGKFRWVP